ncbi:MAG: SWIM zinc finger family protein [Ignavibacteria bacterium]
MDLNNFKTEIPSEILERGFDYFSNNKIVAIEETSDGLWAAEVIGTDTYYVTLEVELNVIKNWECDCPFDGDICKHVVAVIYFISDYFDFENDNTDTNDSSKKNTSKANKKIIEKIFKKISKKEITDFLSGQFKKDKYLKNSFTAFFAEHIEDDTGIKYKTIIQNIIKCAGPGFHGSNNKSTKKLLKSLEELIQKAEKFLESGNRKESLAVCKALIEEIAVEYHRIYGPQVFDSIIANSFTILESITDKSPPMLRDELFDYFLNEFPKSKYYNTSIERLILGKISSLVSIDEQEKAFFDRIDEQIAKREKEDYNGLYVTSLVKCKLNYLMSNIRNDDAKKVMIQYKNYEKIRELLIDKLTEEKEYKFAKTLCDEGIVIDKTKYHGMDSRKWTKKKLEISIRAGNIPEIRSLSRELFYHLVDELKYYKVLKSTYSIKEWVSECEDLILNLNKGNYRGLSKYLTADIFVEENYLDRLLSLMNENSDNIEFIDKYSNPLSEQYPAEAASLFENAIKSHAIITDKRIYYEVAGYLNKLGKLEGSRERVDVLVKYFRNKYKIRKAMMEILKDNFPESFEDAE